MSCKFSSGDESCELDTRKDFPTTKYIRLCLFLSLCFSVSGLLSQCAEDVRKVGEKAGKGREGKVREVDQAVQDQRSVQKGGEVKSNQISRTPKKQSFSVTRLRKGGREEGKEGWTGKDERDV